jgi:hypothetical protein
MSVPFLQFPCLELNPEHRSGDENVALHSWGCNLQGEISPHIGERSPHRQSRFPTNKKVASSSSIFAKYASKKGVTSVFRG